MDSTAQSADQEIIDKIIDIVVRETTVERADLGMDKRLDSLEIDSADMVLVLMCIEEELGAYIPIDGNIAEAETVGDLVETLMDHVKSENA